MVIAAGVDERTVAQLWERMRRLRPANHPVRRLAGIVALLDRLGQRPSERLRDVVESATRPSSIRAELLVHGDDGALIGAGRADEMAVSVVLPFVHAMSTDRSPAREMFVRYPAPPSTRWTRMMQGLLLQGGHEYRIRCALDHQGLHWLYHNFCRVEAKLGCPVCRS